MSHVGGSTVKLTVNEAFMPLPPVTVTVAVYVPGVRPATGRTVKLELPLTAILPMDVVLSVKLPLLVPLKATLKAPVGWLP